jgi:hypothetical protein
MCSKALPNPFEVVSAVRARRDDAVERMAALRPTPAESRKGRGQGEPPNRFTDGAGGAHMAGLPGLAAMRRSCADLFEKLLSSHRRSDWVTWTSNWWNAAAASFRRRRPSRLQPLTEPSVDGQEPYPGTELAAGRRQDVGSGGVKDEEDGHEKKILHSGGNSQATRIPGAFSSPVYKSL